MVALIFRKKKRKDYRTDTDFVWVFETHLLLERAERHFDDGRSRVSTLRFVPEEIANTLSLRLNHKIYCFSPLTLSFCVIVSDLNERKKKSQGWQ